MSNIYLKVILRKNQNFDFLSLKTSSYFNFEKKKKKIKVKKSMPFVEKRWKL